jgi:DNA-directed RNA polymerase specialized sigma24 family protein
MTVVTLPASAARSVAQTLTLAKGTQGRLSRLSAGQQKALSLIVIDGLSYEAAAERLGITVSKLNRRLRAARARISKMIEEENAFSQKGGPAALSNVTLAFRFSPPPQAAE